MKLVVAGEDCASSLGGDIRSVAARRRTGLAGSEVPGEIVVMAWRLSSTDEEYRAHVRRLLKVFFFGEQEIPFEIPPRPSRAQATALRIRLKLRRLLHGPDHGHKPDAVIPGSTSLDLRGLTSEAAYLDELLRLMRHRYGTSSVDFLIPRKPGLPSTILTRLKMAAWSFLRFQTDRITSRQNTINEMVVRALGFTHQHYRAEIARLEQRMAELERAQPGSPQDGGAP